MENVEVIGGTAADSRSSALVSDEVFDSVARQVKHERLVPRIVYAAIGLLVLLSFLKNGFGIEAILAAVFGYFGAKLALFLVQKVYLEPTRERSFDRAADKLKAWIRSEYGPGVQTFSWTIHSPGALGLTAAGQVVVSGLATGYRLLALSPSQIADVKVERRAEVITHTSHSGSTGVGFVGKSFAVGQSFGGRSTSVSQTVEYYALELRYQLERNGKIHTLTIPGDSSRTTVEEICTAIRRMEA